MKFTHASAYAVQAVIHMATQGGDRLCSSEAVAEAHGISGPYLVKILTPLVRAGLLRSVKGAQGGYRLARPASGITLLEIVEAIGGPQQGEAPAVGNESVASLNHRLDAVCAETTRVMCDVLGKVTVADLVKAAGVKGKAGKAK